jgi:hypothetical protein
MRVNGTPTAPVIRASETDASAPAALETLNASGFSSLLFLIFASPQPAASAAPRDGDVSGKTAPFLAADGKGGTASVAGNGAGGKNVNGIDENDEHASHTETSGKTVDEVAAPKLLAATDDGSGMVLAKPSDAPYLSDFVSDEAGLTPGRTGSPEVSADEVEAVQGREPTDEPPPLLDGEPVKAPTEPRNAHLVSNLREVKAGDASDPIDDGRDFAESGAFSGQVVAQSNGRGSTANGSIKAPEALAKTLAVPGTVRKRSQPDVFQSLHADQPSSDRNFSENVIEGHGPRVMSENESAVFTSEQSATIDGKEMKAGGFAAHITGDKGAALSGSREPIIDPLEVHTVNLLFNGHVPESRLTPKPAAIANAPDDTSGDGFAVEPKLRLEKSANGGVENADTRPFGGETKDSELAPAGRAATQSLNEAANPMPGHILSRESAAPVAEERATPWRATIERVASELAAHIQLNKRETILHLDPPELGKIKINLHLNGEKLQAHIFAEAQEARALIENHMSELRQALQSKNLDLVDVRVQGGWQGGMGEGMHGFPQQRHQHAAGRQETIWASGNALESEMVEPKASRSSKSINGGVSMWA